MKETNSEDIVASVIVPTRGGVERLPTLLWCLERQSRQDFEVIVVVDGDVDDSGRLLDEWAVEHPELVLRSIVFPENRGRSAALNAGHDAARGRVLIRCDDDLEPSPNHVDLHVSSHDEDVSAVIGLCANVLPDTAYARSYGERADQLFREEALGRPAGEQWRYWAGNVSVTRRAWQLVGRYDEDYRRYGWEDVDYGYRLRKAGVPVRIVPELTTRHHGAATTTAGRAVRALHAGASRDLFLRKHGADALAGPSNDFSPWNLMVRAVGHGATEDRIQRWGKAIDKASDRIPTGVARKLVALLVEGAARAGIDDPQRARDTF